VRRVLLVLGGVALLAAAAWGVFVGLPRSDAPARAVPAAAAAAAPEDADRRIRATLFYVAENGAALVGVEREIPYAESAVDQAQRLVEAQLQPVAPPLAQAIPDGTSLRSIFITERGEAYVDVSAEISTKHPGGSLEELFTVYAIVNVLTVNLPAISRVQILVDGREVDTIAGHIDMRRPLVKNLKLLPQPEPAAAPPTPVPATGE
jgi:spore germination protein GerM